MKRTRTRKSQNNDKNFKVFHTWTILGLIFVVVYLFAEFRLVADTKVGYISIEARNPMHNKNSTTTNTTTTTVSDCKNTTTPKVQVQQLPLQPQEPCYPTTSYRLLGIDSNSTAAIFQSYYGSNQKTMGGDEFYPMILFNSTQETEPQVVAVGRVSDLEDGRYMVKYSSLLSLFEHQNVRHTFRPSFYNVSLGKTTKFQFQTILQYSCGDGGLPPPTKLYKTDHGALNRKIPLSNDQEWLPLQKPFEPQNPQIDLQEFDRVLAVGDSLMEQLALGAVDRNVSVPWVYRKIQTPLFSDTVVKRILNVVKESCESPLAAVRNHKDKIFLGKMSVPDLGVCSTNKTLLLLNSGVWDLLEDGSMIFPSKSKACCNYDKNFVNHVESMRLLLSTLQDIYPNVTLGWKSMTAAHVHRVYCQGESRCLLRTKYMSTSRAERLLEEQEKLLRNEFPRVLKANLYDLTHQRAHHSRKNDGRHFRCEDEVNLCLEMWKMAFGNSGWV